MLRVGEWSDWVPVDVAAAPLTSAAGQCGSYLKRSRRISSCTSARSISIRLTRRCRFRRRAAMPPNWPAPPAAFIHRECRRTPRAHEGRRAHADEFLTQAGSTRTRTCASIGYALDRFRRRAAVLLLRQRRPGVAHDVARDGSRASGVHAADLPYRSVVEDLYVGSTASSANRGASSSPKISLVVMSDHGFSLVAPIVHVNCWLRDTRISCPCRDPAATVDPGLVQQRGLDANARVRAWPERSVYQRPRPRSARASSMPAERVMRWRRNCRAV